MSEKEWLASLNVCVSLSSCHMMNGHLLIIIIRNHTNKIVKKLSRDFLSFFAERKKAKEIFTDSS
jgi:hypothetical protein